MIKFMGCFFLQRCCAERSSVAKKVHQILLCFALREIWFRVMSSRFKVRAYHRILLNLELSSLSCKASKEAYLTRSVTSTLRALALSLAFRSGPLAEELICEGETPRLINAKRTASTRR